MTFKRTAVIALAILGASRLTAAGEASSAFNPYAFKEKSVQCPAVDRVPEGEEKLVDININYVEVNEAGPEADTILMVHGWPGMWSIWGNQIQHYRSKYHIIAPNLRGFATSGHPNTENMQHTGSYGDFTSDLTCLLDAAGVQKAVCLGHDWGSQLCFEAVRLRPDRFKAAIGLAVPYFPAVGHYLPTNLLFKLAPKLAYQAYFADQPNEAAKELDAHPRKALRAVVRAAWNPPPDAFLTSKSDFLGAFEDDDELEPIVIMSKEEEDYFVEGMKQGGFHPTLQFYADGNRQRSHAFAKEQGNHTIETPSLLILPTKDRVANWRHVLGMLQAEKFMTKLQVKDVDAAHWPHMEQAEQVNAFIDEFLDGLKTSGHDEL